MKRTSVISRLAILISLVIGLSTASYAATLSGRVYEGAYLSEPPTAQGLPNVSVKLYGSYSSGVLGDEVSSDTTGSDGWYGLETEQGYEYLTIVCEGKSGYSFEGSFSIGGSASGEQIEYEVPLDSKTHTGNKFWYLSDTTPPANHPPVATNDSATTSEGTAVDIDVLYNDNDPDNDPLNVQSVTDPPHGSTANNGSSVTYTPDSGFTGNDSFSYTVSDGKGDTDTATVTVTVTTTPTLAPEIDVRGNGIYIPDGDTTPSTSDGTDMGSVEIGSGSVSKIFYIHNTGSDTLFIDGFEITQDTFWIGGELAAQFGLLILSSSSTIAPGDSLPIGVELYPFAAGTYLTTLIINNDDPDENPYNFAIRGTGTAPPAGTGSIRGVKFNDLNENGQKDPGEPGISDWEIALTDSNGVVLTTTTTNRNGEYQFDNLEPGIYGLSEEDKQDWFQTFPAEKHYSGVRLSEGEVLMDMDFGNHWTGTEPPEGTGTIRGMKYNDLDFDGRRDPCEPGLANWKIYVNLNHNSKWEEGEPYAITDSDGNYSISEVPVDYASCQNIHEVMQVGWSSKISYWALQVRPGSVFENIDFGNYRTGTEPPGGDVSGSVVVIKEATPADDTQFLFCADFSPGGFFDTLCQNLMDPSNNTWNINNLSLLQKVSETIPTGWTLTDITITGDTDNGSTVDLANATVDVDFDEGENIVITFKNEKTGEGQYDFGDAPDSFGTLKINGGPYHDIGEVMLGSSVDPEMDGQPSPLADADNDDGISFPLGLEVNQFATVIINVNAPLGVPAAITGWIDYDHSRTFEDTERVVGGTYTGAGTIVPWTETFLVPPTAMAGNTCARFRIYRTEPDVDILTSPTGYGEEGEVEDYYIEIKPEGTTPSGNLISGIKFNDIDGDGVWEPGNGESGLPNWTIWLDTNNDSTPDQTTQTNNQGGFDFPGLPSGNYTVGEESQTGWIQTSPSAPDTFTFTIPGGPMPTAKFLMFGNHGLDYGDAPSSYGSASHDVGGYRLGQLVDAENVPLFSPNADGDDLDNVNDEDGVTLLSDLVIGQTAAVKVQTTYGPGGLGGPLQSGSIDDCHPAIWIDFDRDGSFQDPAERIPASADSYVATPQGIIVTRPFQVPATAVPGTTFMRVRAYRGWLPMGACPLSPTGHYGEGEVEDYEVEIKQEGNVLPPGEIIGGIKFNDLNGNHQQDVGEPGLGGWTIWIDLDGNGAKDAGEETLTNPDGSFYFVVLPDGTYTVYEELQNGWIQTYPEGAGTHTIPVQAGQQTPPIIFGNKQNRDYGDAPANYPSASHELGGPWLGSIPPDAESGMQPNPPGFGDDNNGIDDEDGVTFLWDLVPGQYVSATFIDMDPSGQYHVMEGWIDFNRDGYWDDQTEFMGQTGGGGGGIGHSILSIKVPAGTTPGKTYARFRICRVPDFFVHINPDGDLGPGEVEDYEVEIVADGNTPPPGGMVQGYKFNDLNGNGMWDPNEPPLAGWPIWLDANQNGVEDANDLYTQTGTSGSFLFVGLAEGDYLLGEVQQPGWTQKAPASGTYTVTADPNVPSWAFLFGNQRIGAGLPSDWGDAPDPNYPTLRASNGAYHVIVPGIFLGGGVDAEPDGLPSPDALGDDNNGSSDEDGVTFITPMIPGLLAEVEVAASSAGYLDAWIDFDTDESWAEITNQIFISEPLTSGSNILHFHVPEGIAIVDTYARFRFSSAGGLSPDGSAQDGEVEDYHILLGENGPGVPGEEELPHIKWSQPVIEIDPNTNVPPVFCGWNEPARSTEQSGQVKQWRMDADDFRCLGPIPITRIRWWGGYKAWTQSEPPESQPEGWHIGFWANQVEGVTQDESYPERLVWSLEIPAERVHLEPVGLAEFPESVPEMCFFCEVILEQEEWFHQAEFESNDDVFWITITAIYPADAQQVNQWGWTTRPHVWGNGAVMPSIMGDWPTFDERLFPGRIYPIENSLLCGQNQAYDMCFELLTEQPWVKWDQPFTGIREWQDYSDDKSMTLEQDGDELLLWRQVADDWLCESQAPVAAIVWNGSYIGYGYEACKCDEIPEPRKPDYFLLSIRINAPEVNTESDNYPGEKIWEFGAENYDEVLVGYDQNPDGEPNEPVFHYSVRLPEDAWFRQETPESIYWFSVVAVFTESSGEIPYDWGWTNHSHGFGGPAMSLDNGSETTSQWQTLLDSSARPVDMSFRLFTTPEQQSPSGQVYYSKSNNDGSGFEPRALIEDASAEPAPRINPAIVVDDQGIIHVVWEDYRTDPVLANIMYARSRDGGQNFDQSVMVDDAVTVSTHQANPKIAVDNDGFIHIVWEDYRRNAQLGDIYYAHSTDGGMTFGDDVCVDDLITITSRQINPVIAIDSLKTIHVAWEDYRDNAELGNIYYAKSTDGGLTFGTDIRIDDIFTDTTHQCNPAIAVDPLDIVIIAWEDYRNASHLGDIYCARSTDVGETFQENLMVEDPVTITHRQIRPAVAVDDLGIVYIVWEDYRDNTESGNIYCSRSTDSGKTFENDVMVDDAITISTHQAKPAIATAGQGLVHIVWEDYRDQSGQANIYYSMSSDEGKAFGEDLIVNQSGTPASSRLNPAIAVDNLGVVHLVWQE